MLRRPDFRRIGTGSLLLLHPPFSFFSFSPCLCVCVVGSSLVDDIEIQLECWPRDGPQSKLGFNFLLYMLLLFPISESVSNGNMGGSWRTGFHFFIGRQRFELRLTTNRHIFFFVFGSVYSEFDYFHKNFKKIKINRWKKFQKTKKKMEIFLSYNYQLISID